LIRIRVGGAPAAPAMAAPVEPSVKMVRPAKAKGGKRS